MLWLDVDGARDYLAGGREKKPSRKVVYAMVKAGMRVVPRGDTGRRFLFCKEWIDEFLVARAVAARHEQQPREQSTPVPFQAKTRGA